LIFQLLTSITNPQIESSVKKPQKCPYYYWEDYLRKWKELEPWERAIRNYDRAERRREQKRRESGFKLEAIGTAEQAEELASQIEGMLGSRVRRFRLLGEPTETAPTLSDEELDKLVTDIQEASGDKVMLVVAGDKVMVLPYEGR